MTYKTKISVTNTWLSTPMLHGHSVAFSLQYRCRWNLICAELLVSVDQSDHADMALLWYLVIIRISSSASAGNCILSTTARKRWENMRKETSLAVLPLSWRNLNTWPSYLTLWSDGLWPSKAKEELYRSSYQQREAHKLQMNIKIPIATLQSYIPTSHALSSRNGTSNLWLIA